VPTNRGDQPSNNRLSPDQFKELVAQVSAEVTKNIAPLLTPNPATTQTNDLTEKPIDDSSSGNSSAGQVDSQISKVVREVHSKRTGEQPMHIFQSVSLSLDSRIPAKLRNKIFNNEFVDFGLLLMNPESESRCQFNLVNQTGEHPSLCLEPSTRPKKIHNIDTWMTAFRIFEAVYTQKHPNDAPSLMKYGDTIQDLAVHNHNWKYYDDNFRFLR